MPKHQANLDFVIRDDKVWSQYDLDGQLCCRIEVDRPRWTGLPLEHGGGQLLRVPRDAEQVLDLLPAAARASTCPLSALGAADASATIRGWRR